MLNKIKKEKLFTRRILILAGIKASLLVTLVARLYYLQVVKSKQYKTFSDSNRVKLFLVPPLRGKILDRQGRLLAGNRNYYRVLFDPSVAADNVNVIKRLVKILKLDDVGGKKVLDKLYAHKSKGPLQLYEHLTWNEVSRVEVNTPDLPGVSIDVGRTRYFPTEAVSSHLVGYMGPVDEKEIEKNPLLNHPDFKVGRYGIEKTLESTLRGEAGVRRMEVNAHGLLVRELSKEDSKKGVDVKLTIDRKLQEVVGKRLGEQSGSVVVMDINNGDVLSFVSTPGFDPSEFTYGVSSVYWQELMENENKPLINKAISNQYPPGSTFKLIVTLAALKHGIDPKNKVLCTGHVKLGRTKFHCWKERGHGKMDMKNALMHSCNSYFYNISKKIGIDAIVDMAEKFGLGSEIGILLGGEKPGLLPSRAWKLSKYESSWQVGDTLNVGIGQGYVLSTPLQLAVMVARVASGKKVVPNFVLRGDSVLEDKNLFDDIDVPREHFDLVLEGMRKVVNVPGGTAYGSRIRNEKFAMAGKTGTSQVISKKGLEESLLTMTKKEREKLKNHALFVGFAPVGDPKYAVAVVIEHGGGGSKAAAPVARDVILEVQKINS